MEAPLSTLALGYFGVFTQLIPLCRLYLFGIFIYFKPDLDYR